VYSQIWAFAWDEGFHLLAARLVLTGKRPYADFLFAQPPLNLWWNVLIMRVGGVGWRWPHAASAVETAAAVWLTADYVLRRSAAAGRLAIALTVAVLMALNYVVVWYATLAQAYGMCLLLGIAAFRFAMAASEDRGRWWQAVLAGVAAGLAASATLLAATIGPVLFIWISWRTRLRRSFAYIAGAAAGLGPVLWYLARYPKEFVFDVVGYHIHYRQLDWSDWGNHDFEVLSGWLDSGVGLLLITLIAAGLIVGRARRDVILCGWLAVLGGLYVATAHPTFTQYFTVAMPFAAVLAGAALQELFARYPRRWPLALMMALTVAALGRGLWAEREDMSWADMTAVAKQVNAVAPALGKIYADEPVYLMTGRMPPPGMEWSSGRNIEMPMAQAAPLHVLPQSEVEKQVKAGEFPVVETCEKTDVAQMGLPDLYGQKKEINECFVFWGLKKRDAGK
jgi:hypothetical protein